MPALKKVKLKYSIKSHRYRVDNAGNVYWIDKNKELREMKPFLTRDGYVEYVLTRKDGSKQHVQAQIIVLASFKGYSRNKEKTQVNHKDGNRTNNSLNNLEWVSPKENIRHSFDVLGKKVWNSPNR